MLLLLCAKMKTNNSPMTGRRSVTFSFRHRSAQFCFQVGYDSFHIMESPLRHRDASITFSSLKCNSTQGSLLTPRTFVEQWQQHDQQHSSTMPMPPTSPLVRTSGGTNAGSS